MRTPAEPAAVPPDEGAAEPVAAEQHGPSASPAAAPGRRPPWLRVRLPQSAEFARTRGIVSRNRLHTVCESAACPNIGECWSAGTATFMILGNVCTRSCGFCNVITGKPPEYDADEPDRVADAIASMNLVHVVITSVDRDELPDGGAEIWARTIEAVRRKTPGTRIEVLIGDFKGDPESLARVLDARPDVLAHNCETVPRLQQTVRPQARYERSLQVLARAHEAGFVTKSSLMLGLGETNDEVREVMRDLRQAGVDILTLGQYLQPTRRHLPVERYVTPEEFAELAEEARGLAFAHVESGPLVRSSYHAERAEGAFERFFG
ncbi:MAG: lipoyl synthase [Candidatus Eisenbacteria bacterium]